MDFQKQCEDFAISRAVKMNYADGGETLAEQVAHKVRSNPAIAQRVGMYLVGDYSRATINLAKLDELLTKALAE